MYPKIICGDKFLKMVLPEIENAKKSIDIIVFYWSFSFHDTSDPVSRLVLALQNAIGRGVRVRVLVNSEAVLYQLDKAGFDVRHIYASKLMHPKVMIIDNVTAVVGSHNYTMSGLSLNLEVSVIVKLNGDNNDLFTFFKNLWGV